MFIDLLNGLYIHDPETPDEPYYIEPDVPEIIPTEVPVVKPAEPNPKIPETPPIKPK